jgi:hypothetical protein
MPGNSVCGSHFYDPAVRSGISTRSPWCQAPRLLSVLNTSWVYFRHERVNYETSDYGSCNCSAGFNRCGMVPDHELLLGGTDYPEHVPPDCFPRPRLPSPSPNPALPPQRPASSFSPIIRESRLTPKPGQPAKPQTGTTAVFQGGPSSTRNLKCSRFAKGQSTPASWIQLPPQGRL